VRNQNSINSFFGSTHCVLIRKTTFDLYNLFKRMFGKISTLSKTDKNWGAKKIHTGTCAQFEDFCRSFLEIPYQFFFFSNILFSPWCVCFETLY